MEPTREAGTGDPERAGAAVYSRSGYDSTATASTETISSGQLSWMSSNLPPLRTSASARAFASSRRLGQQRDVVLLHDAKPDTVTLHLTLLEGDSGEPATYGVIFTPDRSMERLWSRAGATSGNRWQMERRRKRLRQAKTVAVGCHQLPESFHGKEEVTYAPAEAPSSDAYPARNALRKARA